MHAVNEGDERGVTRQRFDALFSCTSRGFQWLLMLKSLTPAQPLTFRPLKVAGMTFVFSVNSVLRTRNL